MCFLFRNLSIRAFLKNMEIDFLFLKKAINPASVSYRAVSYKNELRVRRYTYL